MLYITMRNKTLCHPILSWIPWWKRGLKEDPVQHISLFSPELPQQHKPSSHFHTLHHWKKQLLHTQFFTCLNIICFYDKFLLKCLINENMKTADAQFMGQVNMREMKSKHTF